MITKQEVIQYLSAFSTSCQNRYNKTDFDTLETFKAPLALYTPFQLSQKISKPDSTVADLENIYDFLFSHQEQLSFVANIQELYPVDFSLSDSHIRVIPFMTSYFVMIQQDITYMNILLPTSLLSEQFKKSCDIFYSFLLMLSESEEIIIA